MPIYEFECQKCGKISEFSLKLSDPNPSACPKCATSELKKMISLTSFALKGDGWFKSGYCMQAQAQTQSQAPTSDKTSASKPGAAAPCPEKKRSDACESCCQRARP